MENINPNTKELFKAILALKNTEECQAFFEDLCTVKEIENLSQRFQVAQMLDRDINYIEITRSTGASTATIARVKKSLDQGKGGYRAAIGKNSRKETAK